MTHRPVQLIWQGDGFTPANGFWSRICDKIFVVGERYMLAEHHERSGNSHRHYFAAVHDAWMNLPEDQAERYPTSEHFRKTALIRTGFRNERSLVAASNAEALRIAAFIRPVDEYAIVIVKGCVVIEYTAKSQSQKAMGKEDFQASKQAVLDWCAEQIGVPPEQLNSNAGEAA